MTDPGMDRPPPEVPKKLLESKPLQFLINMKELIAVLLFYVTVARAPFTSPALVVSYESLSLLPPAHTLAYLDSLVHQDTMKSEFARRVVGPLVSSQLMQIQIRNTTDTRITDLELSVSGVKSVGDVGGKTTSSRVPIKEVVEKSVYKDNTVSFPNLSVIPPKATVTLLIWGEFDPLFDAPVEVKASTKSLHVSQFTRSSSVAAFIDDNLLELASLFAAVALIIGARRYTKTVEDHA